MAWNAVTLRSAVDTELTLSANQAGITESQLIRFREGMVEPIGGWSTYSGSTAYASTTFTGSSAIREVHSFLDGLGNTWAALGITGSGTSVSLAAFTSSAKVNITPNQHIGTNPGRSFSISSGSTLVTVDSGGTGWGSSGVVPSSGAAVYFNTPVAIGNILLRDGYTIQQIVSVSSLGAFTFRIDGGVAASTTLAASSGVMATLAQSSGSAAVTVTLPNHGIVAAGEVTHFETGTAGSLISSGPYVVASVIDSTSYTIWASTTAGVGATVTLTQNLGTMSVNFYPFNNNAATGNTNLMTSTAWSVDNWGAAAIAAKGDGPIMVWAPQSAVYTAQVIGTAPFLNGGIFVSQPQQILVAWKSVNSLGTQQNLIVRWSDGADYTNWQVTSATAAGSFLIPTGSVIVGGLQAPNYGVIWTDVDCWLMSYVGGDVIFNFTRAGSGCGLIGRDAACVIRNEVFWCGYSNFFHLGAGGVEVIPCSVWDFIFQNIDRAAAERVLAAPNSAFDEITWYFPAAFGATANANRENNAYVKYNLTTKTWDFGYLGRTGWMDVSGLGSPIGAILSSTGTLTPILYQHESGTGIVNSTASPYFKTGWWTINEGSDLAMVDFVMPDFRYGYYTQTANAQLNITFYSADYPNDTARTYGPYTWTSTMQYLTPRIRGRLMAMQVAAASTNTGFWRLGRIRYRWQPAGRR